MNKCTRLQHFQGDVLEPGKKQKKMSYVCYKFCEIKFHEKFREIDFTKKPLFFFSIYLLPTIYLFINYSLLFYMHNGLLLMYNF